MRPQPLASRRVAMAALAGVLLYVTAVGSGGAQGNDQAPPGRDERPGAAPADGGDRARGDEAGGPAAVTVKLVITGRGKPIKQAEVRISFPADAGGEKTRRTNDDGEAAFATDWKGTVKMVVIAADWQSLMRDVTFTGASQQLSIQLTPFE